MDSLTKSLGDQDEKPAVFHNTFVRSCDNFRGNMGNNVRINRSLQQTGQEITKIFKQ